MTFILNLARELAGLFVDDGSLAVATVVILVLVGATRFEGFIGSPGAAVLLCGGILLALLENVVRSARASERR